MSELKPVIEWLKELPDGYRERAIAQLAVAPNYPSTKAFAIYTVRWARSNEGGDFWDAVDDAWRCPYEYAYPPIPDDGGPGCKPKRDMRYVAKIIMNPNGQYDRIWILKTCHGRWVSEASHAYSSNKSAKRGLVRFLKRLGVDENAVRWEGEE